tara:strand:+ start:181 stop:624 length:444 start_codon:yes stop_codon:yes gene_type:complete
MDITEKERFKIYLDRYLDDTIDVNDLYQLCKKLFHPNPVDPLIHTNIVDPLIHKNIIIKKNTLHKGYDLRETYPIAKQNKMNPNVKQVIQQSIHLMNTNDKIVGFTFNNRTKRAWFHYKLVDSQTHTIYSQNKYANRCHWHDLYIKP